MVMARIKMCKEKLIINSEEESNESMMAFK